MAFGGGVVAYGERDAVDEVVPANGGNAVLLIAPWDLEYARADRDLVSFVRHGFERPLSFDRPENRQELDDIGMVQSFTSSAFG